MTFIDYFREYKAKLPFGRKKLAKASNDKHSSPRNKRSRRAAKWGKASWLEPILGIFKRMVQ